MSSDIHQKEDGYYFWDEVQYTEYGPYESEDRARKEMLYYADSLDGKFRNVLGDDIGFVQLVEVLGNDISIVDAARVSYNGKSKGFEQDKKLLNYLWTNKHTSPFEMASMKVIIKCPMFIRSQIMR